MNCQNNTHIRNIIEKNHIFSFFAQTYLFGSILTSEIPNDVDILLVYWEFSEKIFMEKQKIRLFINQLLAVDIPIDFTTLSNKELLETKFLIRISHYLAVYP